MRKIGQYTLAICAFAAWAGLVSCDGEHSAEKAGKKVDEAVEHTGEAIQEGMEKVKDAGAAAVEKTNDVIDQGAGAVNAAAETTMEKAKRAEQVVEESLQHTAQKVKDLGQ